MVHWTLTLEERATGWLDATFHRRFRELTLHAAARQPLLGPVYCLMPDDLHFVWCGASAHTQQLLAMRILAALSEYAPQTRATPASAA
jgi:hypothetical protein